MSRGPKINTERFDMRMEPHVADALKKIAQQKMKSKSEAVRELILEYAESERLIPAA